MFKNESYAKNSEFITARSIDSLAEVRKYLNDNKHVLIRYNGDDIVISVDTISAVTKS